MSRLGRTHWFGLQRAHRARRAGWPLPKEECMRARPGVRIHICAPLLTLP